MNLRKKSNIFILASQSERRRFLLHKSGYRIRVIPAEGVVERHDLHRPSAVVMHNAQLKARVIAEQLPRGVVIGADTIVYRRGVVYGKPRSMRDAARMIAELQGKAHYVYTGVCLIDAATGREHVFYDRTTVYFKRLSSEEIAAYLRRIQPLDKAGAYAIQQHGDMIVRRIDGSLSNVIGFPMEMFAREVRLLK